MMDKKLVNAMLDTGRLPIVHDDRKKLVRLQMNSQESLRLSTIVAYVRECAENELG